MDLDTSKQANLNDQWGAVSLALGVAIGYGLVALTGTPNFTLVGLGFGFVGIITLLLTAVQLLPRVVI